MARKSLPIGRMALFALACAAGGTWAAMRATHTPVPPLPPAVQAAPAKVRAVALQMRQAPNVIKQHLPSHVVEGAAGAVAIPGAPAPGPAAHGTASMGSGWRRQPLGRGEIIEKR